MAHYAFIDTNNENIVVDVIAGVDETITQIDENGIHVGGSSEAWETWYGNFRGQKCVRTSYNAASNGFRKNYAGIGYSWDEGRDAFIPPKPFESWVLDEDTCRWGAPVPYPNDEKVYLWNEESLSWVEVV